MNLGLIFFLNCLFLPLLVLRSAGIFENSRLINFSSNKLKPTDNCYVSGEPCFVQDRSIVPAVNFPGKTVAPPGSGFISGSGEIFVAGPPKYLKVPDYQICLQLYKVGASQLSEYCLPKAKPQNCPVLSWNQLGRVFTGIGCKPQSSNTNVKVSTKQSIIS